jgi:hypothetical protein
MTRVNVTSKRKQSVTPIHGCHYQSKDAYIFTPICSNTGNLVHINAGTNFNSASSPITAFRLSFESTNPFHPNFRL